MLGCARAIACSPDVDSNDALSTHKCACSCMVWHSTKCIHYRSRCSSPTLSTVLRNPDPSAPTAAERRLKLTRSF